MAGKRKTFKEMEQLAERKREKALSQAKNELADALKGRKKRIDDANSAVEALISDLEKIVPTPDASDVAAAPKLKACPWCSGTKFKEAHSSKGYVVECATCLAFLMAETKTKVNRQWNELHASKIPKQRKFTIVAELIVESKDFPPTKEMDALTIESLLSRENLKGEFLPPPKLYMNVYGLRATLGKVKVKSMKEVHGRERD